MKTIEERAVDYLGGRLERPPTLQEVAKHIGVNVKTLRLAFRQAYGVTVDVYGRRLRLEKAKELLRDNSETLNSIALVTGYCDGAGLSAAFKKEFGVSPGRWRKTC